MIINKLAAILRKYPKLVNLLIRLSKRNQNSKLGAYMDRWYLVPPSLRLPFCIRIHHIKTPDILRPPHNHPYTFASMVLRGWYKEERIHVDGTLVTSIHVDHKPFEVYSIEAARYHRIAEVSPGGVWTLIIHPRKPAVYEWGFLLPDGRHVPHELLPERKEF